MRERPAMRLMQLLEEANATVDFIDLQEPELPFMREYGQFHERKAAQVSAIPAMVFDADRIATDHDEIDRSALLSLGCPVIDARNAIDRRGLPMKNVT